MADVRQLVREQSFGDIPAGISGRRARRPASGSWDEASRPPREFPHGLKAAGARDARTLDIAARAVPGFRSHSGGGLRTLW